MNVIDSIVVGYLRVSNEKQTIDSQKLAILEYCQKSQLIISHFIEVTVTSTKSAQKRKLNEIFNQLKSKDTLIVSELSRLGRSTVELLSLVKEITDKGIKLIIIKQNLILDQDNPSIANKVTLMIFSLLAEIERDLIVQRTKEGLIAARSKGKTLGKPKGTIQPSLFDAKKQIIIDYLKKGLSIGSIGKLLSLKKNECRNLLNYIKKRKLRTINNFSNIVGIN